MTYSAQNISRTFRNRFTKKEVDLSGWHVMENDEWLHGPMDESLAKKMAAAYNAEDHAIVRDCHDIIQHGRILTQKERDALCKV